jgi:hypothetical protein
LGKAGASIAAENGASVHELMAIFGWLTMKEAERYTQAAVGVGWRATQVSFWYVQRNFPAKWRRTSPRRSTV